MKSFNNFSDAFNWKRRVVERASKEALPIITEEALKDSKKYTYIQDSTMFESAFLFSNFKTGLIVQRTPYVRRRYYEGGRPTKNPNARSFWWEHTKKENIDKYVKMFTKKFNEVKKQ